MSGAIPGLISGLISGQASAIGTLNEGSIHDALKQRYAQGDAVLEYPIDSYVADVFVKDPSGDHLVEVQTSGFGALRKKLQALLPRFPITLVHPIAAVRHIVKLPTAQGESPSRRRSPKKGSTAHVFAELVYMPTLLDHANLTLDVVLIEEEEIRTYDGKRGRRRGGWVVSHRNLIDVVQTTRLTSMRQLFDATVRDAPDRFTTLELAEALAVPRRLAQQAAYCFRQAELVTIVGKEGNALVYERTGG